MTMRWVLPDFIQDVLPPEAARLEHLRRLSLDFVQAHGYQLVMPPLLEYLDALLTGAGGDLRHRTFQLIDQLSGQTMGLRADMTPQVARIDAQLLNRTGVSRLCYCGSVVHTLPANLTATREPCQFGIELYGHTGIEADLEVVRLLAQVMQAAGVNAERIELSHIGLFRALVGEIELPQQRQESLFALLLAKDAPGLSAMVRDVAEPVRSALLALPELYGGVEVLEKARSLLPQNPQIFAALNDLRCLLEQLQDLPVSLDLADLRGYHYHTGAMFAVYAPGAASALAAGGRYDSAGQAFGRGRPATGASLDLRQLAQYLPQNRVSERGGAILAPLVNDPALQVLIGQLRDCGEVVMTALPGHDGSWEAAGCDRRLVSRNEVWEVEVL